MTAMILDPLVDIDGTLDSEIMLIYSLSYIASYIANRLSYKSYVKQIIPSPRYPLSCFKNEYIYNFQYMKSCWVPLSNIIRKMKKIKGKAEVAEIFFHAMIKTSNVETSAFYFNNIFRATSALPFIFFILKTSCLSVLSSISHRRRRSSKWISHKTI